MKKVPAWLVLLIITIVAGLLLACTNGVTKPIIAEMTEKTAENSRAAVLPAAAAFEKLALGEGSELDWCYLGKAGDENVGSVAQITVSGFGGEIEIIVGVDDQGVLTGISVGGPNFSETAGLGAKTRDAAFGEQFVGKSVPLRVIKAGQEAAEDTVDAVTAATISSTAVTNGVNTAVESMLALNAAPAEE